MKTIVTLTNEQVARLDSVARREHISRAEAIRRAVDRQYSHPTSDDEVRELEAALDDTFGLWADRRIDAVTYVDALRDEWSR